MRRPDLHLNTTRPDPWPLHSLRALPRPSWLVSGCSLTGCVTEAGTASLSLLYSQGKQGCRPLSVRAVVKYCGVFSTAGVTYDEGGSEAKPATSCQQSGEGIRGWGQAGPDKDAQLGMNGACMGANETASETTYYISGLLSLGGNPDSPSWHYDLDSSLASALQFPP